MPILNRLSDLHAEITAWRRDIHAHPELQYDVQRTAATVAEKLTAFGCDEVVSGIGRTGVVGVIRGQKTGSGSRKVIGLRADMDALPLQEANDVPHRSTVAGRCMPAAMTAIPPCCWAPPSISPRRAIFPAPRS